MALKCKWRCTPQLQIEYGEKLKSIAPYLIVDTECGRTATYGMTFMLTNEQHCECGKKILLSTQSQASIKKAGTNDRF